ncbi:MAG: ABC transporter permease [Anaerolineales bacterium]|nr:MAG: ABC transporter permease [Anaerolineales bacterium]
MTNYLIRRLIQMMFVVLLSTLAIYILLNVAPGGPLSGIRLSADRKQRVSEADIKRLEAYLGIDKPLLLRYVAWLVGDDWMGADWMYVGIKPFELPNGEKVRFWSDPGLALLKPGYIIRVYGEKGDDEILRAEAIEARPSGERPEEAIEGKVLNVNGPAITLELGVGQKLEIQTTPDTRFTIPDAEKRPSEGTWLNLSGLLGPYGRLGAWAGFHSDNQGLLRLDWGTSWKLATGQSVLMLIMSRIGNTLLLMGLTTVVALLVSLPIGVYSAIKQYSRLDYTVTTFAFFGSAMPIFWFGLMLVLLFSYTFKGWGLPFFPAGGAISVRAGIEGSLIRLLSVTPGSTLDRAIHLILPTIALSLLYMASWSRFMRSSMLEVMRQDYVRTARAKGLIERIVIAKHALRNALIPVITVVALQLPALFGGAILTETVFSYPGMGRLFFNGLGASDWPVVMVILFISSILVVVATLMRDVIYTVVDPRIRFT